MPTYKITDPTTRKTVKLTGDSAPTEQELNDIFSQIGGSQPTVPTPKPQESGFFSDIASAASNRLSNITNPKDSRLRKIPIVGPSILGPASNVAGQAMGFLAGDLPIAAAKAIIPEGAQREIGQLVATQKGNPIVDIASEAWKANPEDIRNDYENLLNISMVGPQGSLLRGAARGTAAVGKEGFNIARDLGTLVAKKAPAAIEKKLSNVVTKGIEKGVRPTVVGKRTAKKMTEYYGRAKDAVKTIIDNKDNLILSDAEGNVATGELPKTLKQFSEAIEQTKQGIYKQYHSMATEAGESGATFNAEPIINKLDDVTSDLKYNPQVRKYAEDLKAEIGELHGQPPEIVEARIADLNNSLSGYYEGRVGKAKAQVDGSVAKQMREELDNIIMNEAGPGYQTLKNKYGALKSLEKEVNHRAVVDARKNGKGFFDLSDIFTKGEIVGGVLTMNPALIARGTTGLGIKNLYKRSNNPDKIIQKMFGESDRIINKAALSPEMRSATGRAAMGKLSGLENVLSRETPSAVPIPRRPITTPYTTAVGPVRSGVLHGEPYGPAAPTLIQRKQLPAGQGFELNGSAYAPDVIDANFTSSARPIPETPQLVAPGTIHGRLSLPAGQGFELVDRPVLQTPKEQIGTLMEVPPVRDDFIGSGMRAARERMAAQQAAKAREAENLVTRVAQIGIKWTQDYNPKILRQNPDLKRTLNNKHGQSPDAIAYQLQAEGWPIESGDQLIELLKSGQGRKIYNPEKADRLFTRDIRREENEWIEKQLEKEQFRPAEAREAISDHKARIIDEIGQEGIIAEGKFDQALKEISDFFEEMSGKAKQTIRDFKQSATEKMKDERGSFSMKKTTPQAETGNPFKHSVIQEHVYHGTNVELSEFSDTHRGNIFLGNKAAEQAHWFTSNEVDAEHYAESARLRKGGRKNVIKTYLDIRNPRYATGDELYAYREELKQTTSNKLDEISDEINSLEFYPERIDPLIKKHKIDIQTPLNKEGEWEAYVNGNDTGYLYTSKEDAKISALDNYLEAEKRKIKDKIDRLEFPEELQEHIGDFIEETKEQGYDGIIITGEKGDPINYGVFSSKQIKTIPNPSRPPEVGKLVPRK